MTHTQCDNLIRPGSRIALIGSREAPLKVLRIMTEAGRKMSEAGIIGLSGGAPGSDQAWMSKCQGAVIIPYNGFFGHWHDGKRVFSLDRMPTQIIMKAYLQAKAVAPWITEQKDVVQRLYSRNALQVLNLSCTNPVDGVFYWAPESNRKVKGGTAIAVNIARRHGIPTHNLANSDVMQFFRNYTNAITLDDLDFA